MANMYTGATLRHRLIHGRQYRFFYRRPLYNSCLDRFYENHLHRRTLCKTLLVRCHRFMNGRLHRFCEHPLDRRHERNTIPVVRCIPQ